MSIIYKYKYIEIIICQILFSYFNNIYKLILSMIWIKNYLYFIECYNIFYEDIFIKIIKSRISVKYLLLIISVNHLIYIKYQYFLVCDWGINGVHIFNDKF